MQAVNLPKTILLCTGIFIGFFIVIFFNGFSVDQVQLLSSLGVIFTISISLLTIMDIHEKKYTARFTHNVHIFFTEIKKEKPFYRWNFVNRFEILDLPNGTTIAGEESNPNYNYTWGKKIMSISLPTVIEDCFDLPIDKNLKELLKNRDSYIKYHLTENNIGEMLLKKSEFNCLIDILRSSKQIVLSKNLKEFSIAILIGGTLCIILFLLNV